MAPPTQPSRSHRFLRILRGALADGPTLSAADAARLQALLLDIARTGADRLDLVALLDQENDRSISLFLESLLFDAVQLARGQIAGESRSLRGRIEFAKLTGGTLFAGAILGLLTAAPPVLVVVIGGGGLVTYLWGERQRRLIEDEKLRFDGDIAALDELRRMLQSR